MQIIAFLETISDMFCCLTKETEKYARATLCSLFINTDDKRKTLEESVVRLAQMKQGKTGLSFCLQSEINTR